MKRVFRIVIIILLISSMLISSYFIYRELKQNKEQEDNFKNLFEIVIQVGVENNEEETMIDIKELHDMNDDIIGWLRISGTSINYPVMQSIKSPNYYLHKDFYGKYSSYGTPYMSEQCDITTSDNLIIYGHHIKNKKIFGALEDYKKKEFYDNHPIIEFTTLEGKEHYRIFAVFKTVIDDLKGFKYYKYTDFKNESEFYQFVNKSKENAMYETNVIPQYGNKIITLSTCEYSNKNGRLVVIASEIKD